MEKTFSISRLFLSYKKLRSPLWVGGRVVEKNIKNNLLVLKIFGQGKTLTLKKSLPKKKLKNLKTQDQILYKTLSSIQMEDLITLLIDPTQLSLKKKQLLIPKIKSVKILFQKEKLKSKASSQRSTFLEKNSDQDSNLVFQFHKSKNKKTFNIEKAQKWNTFIMEVRSFFNKLGLIEIQTPSLVQCPGIEHTLNPFSLEFEFGSKKKKLFLPTSPELHLKKLLCENWSDIFEIKNCFRNSELSPLHEPEFWMLEWYRAFSDLNQIEKDLKKLLSHLKRKSLLKGPLPILKKTSLKELFKKHLDFPLNPKSSAKDLRDVLKKHKIRYLKSYDWNDLFYLLFLEKIEPQLKKGAYLIYHYPPQQAALSRLNQKGWALRFEFYWKGLEISNAFDELTDFIEHIKRFKKETLLRKKNSLRSSQKIPMDKNFLLSLKKGMPPSGGIALGLDRLFLACQGLKTLRDIRPFSLQDQLE